LNSCPTFVQKASNVIANFTACTPPLKTYFACSVDDRGQLRDSFLYVFTFWTSIITAVLSPVAVVGNALVLAAIWKKAFPRTLFHILLSGLAFTDLWLSLLQKPWSAFLLTGKTGENFPPDGTVQFFLQKKWNGSSCTI